jgi:hypothetical protein
MGVEHGPSRRRNAWMGWGVSLHLTGFVGAAQVATVL